MEEISDAELDRRFPKHEQVYKHIERYAKARPDFLWFEEKTRFQGMIEHAPTPRLPGHSNVGRCHIWKGKARRNNQDALYIRGVSHPIVKVIWELAFGPIEEFRGGILHPKRVVRPICCDYKTFGVCVNAYHLEVRPPTGGNPKTTQAERADLLHLWAHSGSSARGLAKTFGLSERYVHELVASTPRKGNG